MATVGLLERLRRSLGIGLVLGHVDHGLRPESAQEATAVADLADQCGLAHLQTRLDLERGSGLPERAREARRKALLAQAESCGAAAIVLGHTATDQAESMLMHMVRGAGLDGIAGMASYEARASLSGRGPSVALLRPVLGLTRAQTRALVGLFELPFVDDPSNRDTKNFRVAVREQLFSTLSRFNPRVEQALCGAAEQARDAQDALSEWCDRELRGRHRRDETWDLRGFHSLPRAIRTRVLRSICLAEGADPAHLRYSVVVELTAAATAISAAYEGARRSPGGERPRTWDLRPRCCIRIDKNGLQRVSNVR